MASSQVFFTNLRTTPTSNLLDKMERLVRRAGIAGIDFENRFAAIKIHFGEPGNMACSVSTGSSDGSNRRSICRSSTTDTLIGRLRKFTAGRDPVTITSSIRTESAKRSGTALRAEIMPQHAIAAHR